jgi:SpoVK/Ycf46/Vps4 family AAA+-type ATPase
MIYKMLRKKNKFNASKIAKYNKFLTTLDSKEKKHNSNIQLKIDEIKDNNCKENKSEETLKKEIQNIIDKINNNFTLNEYSSEKFNGISNLDIFMENKNIHNPNDYDDNFNNIYFNTLKYLSLKKTEKNEKCEKEQNQEKVEIKKQFINIEIEINDINDILKIVETYKLDPQIEYNINLKALHDIKLPLIELNNMIGMKDLKTNIVDQILYFIQDLHKNDNFNGDFMHTVIYGPPGTGKTEIAKIMGKIYSKIGLLNKGTFKKVTRSDLIAGYLGQTALKTKDVINEALGGVLFIDEAYSLGNSEKRDSFSKERIDTLCEALSDNKENLMVIIAGYEDELKECFFNYNQGLESRFTWRFKTDDYSYEDLYQIFLKKIKDIGWDVNENSGITAEWFKKNKDSLIYYGRDIENIISKTKISHSRRIFGKTNSEKKKINIKDLDKGFENYIKNNDIKRKLDEKLLKKQLYSSLYC